MFDDRDKVEQWIKEYHVPALGFAVLREGELREIRMFGELKGNSPASFNSIFNVASLTKPVFTLLILKLVSSGDLSLDEPLSDSWIDPDIVDDPRHRKLSPRIVLSHQTGFKNWRYLNESGKLKFEADPGTKFGYSGEGFDYLRKAVELKFRITVEKLADSLIFGPLGMKETRFKWDEHIDEARFARWHDSSGKIISQDYKINCSSAADNLLTTLEDYGRFAQHILQGGGLDSNTFGQMVYPHVPTKHGLFMGLGWEMFMDLGPDKEYALTHSGSDPGVQTLIVLLPVSKQGLIVFTNGDNGYKLYERLVVELLDRGREMMDRIR